MTTRPKVEMDIELLLRWAYVDELSKRQCSAAEGIWDRIQDYQNHGGVDSGRGAAQRYSHFGLPDPDAERIEVAVSALTDTVIDWPAHHDMLAGDIAGLITINDLMPARSVSPHQSGKVGWGERGTKALKAMFAKDPNAATIARERPRDVLMVGGIKTKVLVTMHAIKGTRPDWRDESPLPAAVPATRGTGPSIVGECRGKNLYSTGSHCPLEWWPSPLSVVTSRADYFAWYRGLRLLAESLQLERFTPLLPKAPVAPWLDDGEDRSYSRVVPVVPNGCNDVAEWGTLPLKPQRPKAGAPFSVHGRENPAKLSGSVMRGLRVGGESLT